MEATSSDVKKLAVESAAGSGLEAFIWDSYIRLKVTFPPTTNLETSLELVSKEFEELWNILKPTLSKEEGQHWCTPLTDDTSKSFFFLIGIPTLPTPDLAKSRICLKDWQKATAEKYRGTVSSIEVKLVPHKVFLEHGFEIYSQPSEFFEPKPAAAAAPGPHPETKKAKKKETFPAAGNFKKIKGSNPAEVRRQFLEHSMNASGSSTPGSVASSGKLRPGKEVLSRMKFDEAYDVEEFVVGYIDRKEGILEVSVREWESVGRRQEELLAYVKNRISGLVVWDKASKVDLVFGGGDR